MTADGGDTARAAMWRGLLAAYRRSAADDHRQAALEGLAGRQEHEESSVPSGVPAMKLLGLDVPLPSNGAAIHDVLVATAATLGFGLGSWLLGAPLDRPAAVSLFIGLLYIMLADPFLALKDARGKRYALAGTGAVLLLVGAALLEQVASL
jgi:hypothetical protein